MSELFIFEPYKGTSHTTVALNVPPDCRRAHDVLFIYCNYCILNIFFTIYSENIREITALFHNAEHVTMRESFYYLSIFKMINLENSFNLELFALIDIVLSLRCCYA